MSVTESAHDSLVWRANNPHTRGSFVLFLSTYLVPGRYRPTKCFVILVGINSVFLAIALEYDLK